MDEKTIIVQWGGKTIIDNIDDSNGKEDYGLYQIYGYHPVFRDNSLLYIGMAEEQTFEERLNQHQKTWLKEEYDITLYIGRITSINRNEDFNDKEWSLVLKDSESLLIYFHSPPYNSQDINKFPEPNMDLRIFNVGDSGDLYPELSHMGLRLYH